VEGLEAGLARVQDDVIVHSFCSARTAGTMNDRRHAPPSCGGPEANPLATIATPMPDQASDPATERLAGSVASKTISKMENAPKPAASPATQVADEMKRSEQPDGGQAELQVACERRQHDSVGDACDADAQADREHRNGQQHERGIPDFRAVRVHGLVACEEIATTALVEDRR